MKLFNIILKTQSETNIIAFLFHIRSITFVKEDCTDEEMHYLCKVLSKIILFTPHSEFSFLKELKNNCIKLLEGLFIQKKTTSYIEINFL